MADSTYRPTLWTPGDWNAFFGFGTNILVNMLTLTFLLRVVVKMPELAGVRAHSSGCRTDDVSEHHVLRVSGLATGQEDRPQ